MSLLRKTAAILLAVVFTVSLGAGFLAPHPYSEQFRDAIGAAPSRQFPLGTDELGRDRFSRLLYGCRVSLVLAPAGALLAVALAGVAGGVAGYFGGLPDKLFVPLTDLFLSLPWLFLFLTIRALIPLNAAPLVSAIATFLLLGLLGWAGPARVARAAACSLRQSDFLLQAKAAGRSPLRLLFVDLLPNLRPVLAAQFWLSIPLFVLAEANLGLLGLGVSEPLPSLGTLLKELETFDLAASRPYLLAPALTLLVIVGCLYLIVSGSEAKA